MGDHFCREEVRLNRRLAPDWYLDAVPITGDGEAPVIAGASEPVEWAVRMREFEERSDPLKRYRVEGERFVAS